MIWYDMERIISTLNNVGKYIKKLLRITSYISKRDY
jgi:hypothetical protein